MNAHDFVETTTAGLQSFIAEAFDGNSLLPAIDLRLGLPDAGQVEALREGPRSERGLFGRVTQPTPVYLVAYHVARVNSNRTTNRVAYDVEDNGVRKAAFAREAESYRLKYFVLGPPLTSNAGQRVLGALVSLFFDQVQIALARGSDQEIVRLHEPTEQSDELASALLRQADISLSPLYFFHTEVKVATGTPLAQDNLVRTRRISLGRQN